jgi:hypothetical protein
MQTMPRGGVQLLGVAIQAYNRAEEVTRQDMNICGDILQEEPLREPPVEESPSNDVSMQDLLQVHKEWEQACFCRHSSEYVVHATGYIYCECISALMCISSDMKQAE